MAKDHLNEYELFYQEIPTRDYLSEFDTEIEDLVEERLPDRGLDASQVSRLAQDTEIEPDTSDKPQSTGDPQLFKDQK